MYCVEQLLDSIHRAAPIAIGVTINRTLFSINDHMCKMLGYPKNELIGQSAAILYATREEFDRVGKEKYDMIKKEKIGTVETQWLTKDGNLIDILLSSTPTDGKNVTKATTFTATDITQQRKIQRELDKILACMGNVISDRTQWLNENNCKLEKEIKKRTDIEAKLRASKNELEKTIEQLKQTQAQIIQSEKMASIGQLAAGIAHEINNPTAFVSSNLNTMAQYQTDIYRLLEEYEKILSAISQSSEASNFPDTLKSTITDVRKLAEEIDLDFVRDDFPELISESKEGTERIKKIVSDLKDFAHPGDQRWIEFDINEGLDSTINILWNQIKYTCELSKDYGDIPPILCYSQQINQVFMNILMNAAQAIEKGGRINVLTSQSNGYVIVKIRDNGPGIPEEIRSQIFDPFFTTKDIGKGTGLGLSMAYSIIEKHNGKIEVESTKGKGTCFSIYLPSSL